MDLVSLLLLLGLVLVFYFLLIRPQQKQRRHMMELQQALTPGAKVMTGAGLHGTVVEVLDDTVVLEVAPGVNNTYARRAIVEIIQPSHETQVQTEDEPGLSDEKNNDRDVERDEPSGS